MVQLVVRSYRIILHIILHGIVVTSVASCITERNPVLLKGSKDTFALPNSLKNDEIHITTVEVWECNDKLYCDKIVWEVQALHPVPSNDFTVTVGEIPNGFIQKTPIPPTMFFPKKGVVYKILIIPNELAPHFAPGSTIWVYKQ